MYICDQGVLKIADVHPTQDAEQKLNRREVRCSLFHDRA